MKMRFLLLCVALCVSLDSFYSLPNVQRKKDADETYLELARELADELIEEALIQHADNPPYRDTEANYLENARDMNAEVKKPSERGNSPPYKDTYDEYLDVAREVADQYLEEKKNSRASQSVAGARTAADSLRSFNRQSRRTQRVAEKIERDNAEIEALLLIASGENSNMARQLHDIDLTSRRARPDPHCNDSIKINCTNTANRNHIDDAEFRTIDGSCNNLRNYTWGMAGVQHRRLLPDAYDDGRWNIRILSVNSTRRPRLDVFLPSARNISNIVHSTIGPKEDNDGSFSIALFYFMQFIDHDIVKTPEGEVGNRDCSSDSGGFCMPITTGVADERFDANYTMGARRSFTLFRCNDSSGFQNQINEITVYLDGSMIYGSSLEEEALLRSYNGGHLKQSTREFMPNSTRAEDLACNVTSPDICYEAGDKRADVHPGLTTYHTIFVREHNRIAKKLASIKPAWNDERIYQETRKIVGAEIQHIVYNEMLPALIRETELNKYNVTNAYAYDESIDASVTQGFSMSYRYHNLMPHQLHLAKQTESNEFENFAGIAQETVFQKPNYIAKNSYNGINEVALGMIVSSCPFANRLMNRASRDFLFLDKNGDSFDLVALNIMRGREWGMPSYTEYRAYCGLGTASTWEDLLNTTSEEDVTLMKSVYANVRDVDLWTGVVTEVPLPGSMSGPTQSCLIAKQFAELKHGDRLWYESAFSANQLNEIKKTTLARILCDNIDVSSMRSDVFRTDSSWRTCSRIKRLSGGELDLSNW